MNRQTWLEHDTLLAHNVLEMRGDLHSPEISTGEQQASLDISRASLVRTQIGHSLCRVTRACFNKAYRCSHHMRGAEVMAFPRSLAGGVDAEIQCETQIVTSWVYVASAYRELKYKLIQLALPVGILGSSPGQGKSWPIEESLNIIISPWRCLIHSLTRLSLHHAPLPLFATLLKSSAPVQIT